MAEHYDLGKRGEQLAVEYLKEKGYFILKRNWRYEKAEIDIIAMDENTLVFVEVKTRSTLDFGLPQEFITRKKINLMILAANAYTEQYKRTEEIRFDVLGIHQKGDAIEVFEHLENAFYHF
ncbi:YraN family protein [Myroides indicus]|uniref:UPF0102 protein C8P70_11938 n=1 Tax=Myroides indicus TaxID=1323422 RepID=A0A4R7EXQ5_9FLAO|nr:YraN family protein [Myroides indicus]TDS56602.1 putative endonuclease [Myroides indicus]